jgi:hypothetical protein
MGHDEVVWFDASGRPARQELAVSCEIHHFDDQGNEVGRTYGTLDSPRPNPDRESSLTDPDVADAIKALSWDLWKTDHSGPVATLPDLVVALGVGGSGVTDDERRAALTEFVTLPAWKPAPNKLKKAVYAYLEGGPWPA